MNKLTHITDSDEDGDDEDNAIGCPPVILEYHNGNNEKVNINRKWVKFFENHSVYSFRQFGHQCICKICNKSKNDVNLLKCKIC